MYIRRKKDFRALLEALRSIENDPGNLELVGFVNHRLAELILDAEEAIARHIAARKDLTRQIRTKRYPREEVQKLRGKIRRVEGYISAHNDQIYLWKCFGDALAFIYLDPFSVKHVFYDTEDYEVKRGGGALGGKTGLENELRALDDALENGVPAILCDATNALRYGDICLLGGSDPYPIEVKSSKRLNRRGQRQVSKLEELGRFLEDDEAVDFRGQPGRTSRMTSGELSYHHGALNEAVERALQHGYSIVKPELGVAYLCVAGDEYPDAAFDELNLNAPEVYFLNEFKNQHAWACYLPFLLSIRNPEHVLGFLEGRVIIVVFVEVEELVRKFLGEGWEARYRPGEQYTIQCLNSVSAIGFGVSSHFIARVAFDFLSFDSIVSTQKLMPEFAEKLDSQDSEQISLEKRKQWVLEMFGDDEWVRRILAI